MSLTADVEESELLNAKNSWLSKSCLKDLNKVNNKPVYVHNCLIILYPIVLGRQFTLC